MILQITFIVRRADLAPNTFVSTKHTYSKRKSRAFGQGRLTFAGTLKPLENERALRSFLRILFRQNWVVYAKPPFGGPQHVIGYLARYTHRVAISNHRLLAFDQDRVTFRWKDYAHGNQKKKMTLSSQEFLRRFLLHVLPRGFVRIRFFGFLANRCRRTLLPQCRFLLNKPHRVVPATVSSAQPTSFRCPRCAGPMIIVETIPRSESSPFIFRSSPFDSS